MCLCKSRGHEKSTLKITKIPLDNKDLKTIISEDIVLSLSIGHYKTTKREIKDKMSTQEAQSSVWLSQNLWLRTTITLKV